MKKDEVKKTEADWKKILTPEQYQVLREKGTEHPFTGKYVHTKDKGMYVCTACGNKLFSSDAKFDSGTGWPSFTQPAKTPPCYVYVLRMSNAQFYVGSTLNLKSRIAAHNSGKVFTTRKYLPATLIHYEIYNSEKDARQREKELKYHGNTFAKLKARIVNNNEISLAGFTDPANRENVKLQEDLSQGMRRVEVLCRKCGSHLGHVFNDGPGKMPDGREASGKRYCINSCALELKPEKEN